MAEALSHFLEQLRIHTSRLRNLSSEEALVCKRDIAEIFQFLMSRLGKMILRFENEKVEGLLQEMELRVDHILALPKFGKSLSNGVLQACEELCNIRFNRNIEAEEETVVGFEEEVKTLLDQLTANSSKQLQVISIAGMAGVGKTTLARKLYTDPLIEYIFDIRAWTCVSQVYVKKALNEVCEMSEEQLGEKLYRLLKGRQYLVVLDDIWDCKAWNDLRVYFPDDKTGSRVLFTSRDIDLNLHVRAARPAHVLRLRTADESWDIFQKKVCITGICSYMLKRIGREITDKCEGLPLAIIITVGLLKNHSSHAWWRKIAESLRSIIIREPSQYMDSLALSYNHLPPHLKQCFVFVGVFPEDYDIPVTKLIWLWIAQGFIHDTGCRILEDVAQDFLMDLIKRSLLMTAKMRADGQIKACRIHDLLREFCLRKAKEENFSPQIYKDAPVPAPTMSSSSIITNMHHGMPLDGPALPTRFGFCYPFEFGEILQKGRSILSDTYKSLRILDVESVPISLFPHDVILLANLRYLAIQARDGSPQASISNLVNLQMLIISSRKNIVVPKTIWNMVNLRHLYIKSGENLLEEPCFVQDTAKDGCPSVLASLQTLSQISPQSCHDVFSRTPNLRKLGFCGPLISSQGVVEFPSIGSLQQLQELKLLNTIPYPEPTTSCNPFMFPENLKKLTLSNTGMDWEEMWTISLLPNLEVLKLKFHACIGEKWDTSDAKFQRLKILKLHGMNVHSKVYIALMAKLYDDFKWKYQFPMSLILVEVNGCSFFPQPPSSSSSSSEEIYTMAEALSLLLKQLLIDINQLRHKQPSAEGDHIKDVDTSLAVLMNHLRMMMLGYESKEVQALFEEIELKMDRIVAVMGILPSEIDAVLEACEKLYNIRYGSTMESEQIVVGFDDEVETLLDQLTGTSTKQLQVISITGMAGLGKTTLARKLYRDPLIEYFFESRAWACVSQDYLKRDLLLTILSSFINDLTESICKMSDEQLGEKLYRFLKGRRYLVVLDDVWDCKALNDLQIYFPDDQTGSRVLITSRHVDLSLHVRAAGPVHVLRLRTEGESWDIFQMKVFRSGICPLALVELGRVIARKCEGLPLAIVITAGLAKNLLSHSWWSEIAGSLHSYMVRDPSQYMDTLALSYNHLPSHLRTCFLFLGVFPEDYDIPTRKLIWQWIAQGLIHETGNRTLEDAAEDVLMDLIKRSLLMAAKKGVDGQVNVCRIHDLLRDLCLRKAEEENSSPHLYKYGHVPASSSTIMNMPHEMSLNPPALNTHSGFCYPFELGKVLQEGGFVPSEAYKSLRILDVESIPISSFPCDVVELGNLRYLAIQARDGSPQSSISNLVHLQMLIISSRKNIFVPKTIWNMVNLRHIYIKSGENLIEEPCFVQVTDNDGCPNVLSSLQTLSQVSPQSCHNIFSRTPNLRKIGFCGPLISSEGDLEFPNIRSLEHLQKLKLLNTIPFPGATRSCNPLMFPEKLRKLTLSNTSMDWEEMWVFAWLPNLEVLKLKFHACIGEKWDMSDAKFERLKILKLQGLDLRQWVCWRDNFPGLQRLVVRQCLKLESIPSDIGRISTLDVIEVRSGLCTKDPKRARERRELFLESPHRPTTVDPPVGLSQISRAEALDARDEHNKDDYCQCCTDHEDQSLGLCLFVTTVWTRLLNSKSSWSVRICGTPIRLLSKTAVQGRREVPSYEKNSLQKA
ncbi:hypothetical protein OSB04_018362 [Centaurea solstitialis]|uniref:Uncharacterized protein n=1 Tax=Centaurea solstitialis TaxID=347529 RepID=A0AA38WAE2_9ASTR|nr:hypothetical protein OSB04_018362 [Centaurea solstitialis]